MSKPRKRMWQGRTPADRAAHRRAQLIEAGADLLGQVGAAGTSMRGVCRRAALSERYFYESFAGLDELMIAVLDEFYEQTEVLTPDDIADGVAYMVTRPRHTSIGELWIMPTDQA
ncbi:TetR family transcriptional regulator [Nocardia sp. NPDC049526]|uniref:TetR/AcrR family transcriptional regulator n=1 Tax=Nocardia sp. NPDC049526 TaxID=3364316 RepID=UPI00378F0FA6